MKTEELKIIVRDKYQEIASQSKTQNQSSCCGSSDCCDDMDYTIFSDDYTKIKGYVPDADLALGCGLPTEYAGINEGDHILDLGSGAGNDCFVARSIVGKKGKVTGLDFTDAMLDKARKNLEQTGYDNIEFVKGDIENMPLHDSQYDVVISNCVLNLVPDKKKALKEIYRVLKPLGHFCISDVVTQGLLPQKLKEAAEMYAGCVSGALQKVDYLKIVEDQGFTDLSIQKEKPIVIPENILKNYLSSDEIEHARRGKFGVFSITLSASKPDFT